MFTGENEGERETCHRLPDDWWKVVLGILGSDRPQGFLLRVKSPSELPTSVVTTRALTDRIPFNYRNIQLLPLRLAWSSLHIPSSRAHGLFSKTRVDVDSPIASGLLQLRDASANGDRRPRAWQRAP